MEKSATTKGEAPSRLIDARIAALGDWRGETLARVRKLIKQADPEVVEAWKWRGVPVWERDGIICTGETYKAVVKLTFAKGAALEDPSGRHAYVSTHAASAPRGASPWRGEGDASAAWTATAARTNFSTAVQAAGRIGWG